ncbi:MAG TPA: serine dehydrogenasease [Alphaproteobacteria bacterium]|nr:serine dehydrogenasease [Alphaproteobacteria bacterium]
MEVPALDSTIRKALDSNANALAAKLQSDIAFYHGPIYHPAIRLYRDLIEGLGDGGTRDDAISIFLTTDGGSVEVVEKLVEITRHHYERVYFIVPEHAMSAGTIWCLSGDKILMDYSSSLGPIDPQIMIQERGQEHWVPALGYLDQVERMLAKSLAGTLTDAELTILQGLDLAQLRRYEQARDLSVDLIHNWLAVYKFRDWKTHRTDPNKLDQPVTDEEKAERAKEIAAQLGNNSLWHAHGRMIGMNTLRQRLRLEIDDFGADKELSHEIRVYSDVVSDYASRMRYPIFLHGASRLGEKGETR